jgi:hypothetical protein
MKGVLSGDWTPATTQLNVQEPPAMPPVRSAESPHAAEQGGVSMSLLAAIQATTACANNSRHVNQGLPRVA